ncbi:MAG: class I SAM-dependent methyltransferase [Anaplasmataceae bacterium]|nr:class I SAM-dependent methyltransferase [Anaplasmataceae bacterium]
MSFDREVTINDFAESFGSTPEEVQDFCGDIIPRYDFRYRILKGEERDQVILTVLKKLESDTQVIGAEERTGIWEKGWAENLESFKKTHDEQSLVPKFIRPNQPIRFAGEYILPSTNNFELDYFSVLRRWLFKKYLKNYQNVYEFGCGTGFNLLELARLYPDKKLHGSDFVSSSKDLVNEIAKTNQINLEGRIFNMRQPDSSYILEPGSAVMHFGAVEQLASDIDPLFNYLLRNKPALCLALEPTVELYDDAKLFDHLAIKFHRKRGYTEGYLPRLQKLEKEGKVEIIKTKRTYFGSLLMEGFSYIVWRVI